MRVLKTVSVQGINWSVISANERSCCHSGRFFMARRCNSRSPWRVSEHDCDITVKGMALVIRRSMVPLTISELSIAVKNWE
jgi:hypothetical protein